MHLLFAKALNAQCVLQSSIKELACKSRTKPTQKAQLKSCGGMMLPAINVEKAIKMVTESNKGSGLLDCLHWLYIQFQQNRHLHQTYDNYTSKSIWLQNRWKTCKFWCTVISVHFQFLCLERWSLYSFWLNCGWFILTLENQVLILNTHLEAIFCKKLVQIDLHYLFFMSIKSLVIMLSKIHHD